MTYRVQGSWDGKKWWNNQKVEKQRSEDSEDYDFESFEMAHGTALNYVKQRPFKHRRIMRGDKVIIWSYAPEDRLGGSLHKPEK